MGHSGGRWGHFRVLGVGFSETSAFAAGFEVVGLGGIELWHAFLLVKRSQCPSL